MKKGPYEVRGAEVKYKNPWITVTEEKVIRPDGKEGIFGVIDYGRGTSTVALDESNNIFLVREYYYALEEYGLQLPSGDIAEGETPQQAAARELLEEAGAVADEWTDLGMTNPFTMILRSPAYLFLARGAKKQQEPEPETELVIMPFDEAYTMVMDSKITHGPSCIAILKAKTVAGL
jgi:ADP-ribose pyrophosphatase